MCLFCNDIFIDLYRTHVNVPITESELLIVIMIGGSKNLSVIFTIALSNAVAMSWLNEIIIYLLCYG